MKKYTFYLVYGLGFIFLSMFTKASDFALIGLIFAGLAGGGLVEDINEGK